MKDRKITISLYFVGRYLNAESAPLKRDGKTRWGAGYFPDTVEYTEQEACPSGSVKVKGDGTIHLDAPPPGYNVDCDLLFKLDPRSYVDPTGAPDVKQGQLNSNGKLDVKWAKVVNLDNTASAMICGLKAEDFILEWLDVVKRNLQNNNIVLPVPGITVHNAGDDILIDDNDQTDRTYYYRPAVVIPSVGDYYISLDPAITKKPGA